MSSSESQASLIGVAIACSGNVLISLALTIQKLAHQRRVAQFKEAEHHSPATPPRSYGAAVRAPVTPCPVDGRGRAEALCTIVDTEGPSLAPSAILSSPASPSSSSPPSPTRRAASPTDAGYLRSRLWWLGLGLMGIGEAGNFLSYGFAPASVIAPLGTVALVANCVFAPVVLGESFTRRNVLGMALAILGAVTVVWSSRDDNKRLSPDELLEAITALPFVLYTAINIALLFPLTYLSASPAGDKYIGIDIGLCALFGGYTVMATKALSSLLSTKLILALEYPIAWLAIAVLVITSVLQIKFLNRALMRFESKEVIPTQFVFFSLSAIIGSAVLYQEFRGVSRSDFVNFAFGIATTFLGVYFLTTPSEPPVAIIDEEAPLITPERASYTLQSHPRSPPMSTPLPPKISPLLGSSGSGQRVSKRTSQQNLDIPLTLNSPGALILLATTPPVTTAATAIASARHGSGDGSRGRSASRGTVDRVLEALSRR